MPIPAMSPARVRSTDAAGQPWGRNECLATLPIHHAPVGPKAAILRARATSSAARRRSVRMPSSGCCWRRKRKTAQGSCSTSCNSRNAGIGRPSAPSCHSGKRTPRLLTGQAKPSRDLIGGEHVRTCQQLRRRIRTARVGTSQRSVSFLGRQFMALGLCLRGRCLWTQCCRDVKAASSLLLGRANIERRRSTGSGHGAGTAGDSRQNAASLLQGNSGRDLYLGGAAGDRTGCG